MAEYFKEAIGFKFTKTTSSCVFCFSRALLIREFGGFCTVLLILDDFVRGGVHLDGDVWACEASLTEVGDDVLGCVGDFAVSVL